MYADSGRTQARKTFSHGGLLRAQCGPECLLQAVKESLIRDGQQQVSAGVGQMHLVQVRRQAASARSQPASLHLSSTHGGINDSTRAGSSNKTCLVREKLP